MQKKHFFIAIIFLLFVFMAGLNLAVYNTSQLLGVKAKYFFMYEVNRDNQQFTITFLGWKVNFSRRNSNWEIKTQNAFSCDKK